ncbi:DNA-binding GntR family transcriptional regulator [Mycetocola sp. BIGb0189]|uniref:GntR family transcriptional regulator n=1 Tax=Mycetocola sp. BIGb0189 TaxID=2940604 RepID=UPI00216AAE61|nr:GntR family transcriptional regulator [Mycetocola sp. BIGb0189]MCS4277744.1 DNA-binding GntR family transcriptional regulator [Mycetocola sp. BIGb0189]
MSAVIPNSLSERVFERIRDRIIDGTLAPGERLRERELATELEVSRVPVREALPRLLDAGYIAAGPGRGTVVRDFDRAEVIELFDVRAHLDVLAAESAARNVAAGADTTALAAALAAVTARATSDGARSDSARAEVSRTEASDGATAAAAVLHAEIVKLADNSLLTRLLRPVLDMDRRLAAHAYREDHDEAVDEHRSLAGAILRGRPEAAAGFARAHVAEARQRVLDALNTTR